jgi:hypothetical protein
MATISQIVGWIDPIGGKNDEAVPNDITKPYHDIDFFYNSQRTSDPLLVLTAQVLRGEVSLEGTEYFSLAIANDANNALLNINGHIGKSIVTDTFILSIDTVLHLPSDMRQGEDVPVLQTKSLFKVEAGYTLSIEEDNPDRTKPNIARPIFDMSGIVSIALIDTVVLNRDTIVWLGGNNVQLPLPTVLEMSNQSAYYVEEESTINVDLAQPAGDTCAITIYADKPAKSKILVLGECYSPAVAVITSAIATITFATVILAPIAFESFWHLFHSKICDSKKVSRKVNGAPPNLRIIGGSIQANSNNVVLTNVANSQITGVNLVNVMPFSESEVAQTSDYTLTQEFSSINSSGSTFRRPTVISSNYTHTKFDGTVFMIIAKSEPITITIPNLIGDERVFEYKRIDSTDYPVYIKAEGGIEDRRCIKICPGKSLQLYGYKGIMYVF